MNMKTEEQIEEYYKELDIKIFEGCDKIGIFMGGTIEPAIFGGTQFRFDKPGTPQYAMKCPPFGVIGRADNHGNNLMRYADDWNWLMAVIKCCSENLTSDKLIELYQSIIDEIKFHAPIVFVFYSVVAFIDEFNLLKTPKNPE